MSNKSSRSKSSSESRDLSKANEGNCKVYVSNVHRDVKDQQLKETFLKFGQINYFIMKRKPNEVTYAFIEYKAYQSAHQAVEKMNKTNYYQRTLNVQFGKGGKHHQQHYETIAQLQPKNKYSRQKSKSFDSGRYDKRQMNKRYELRKSDNYSYKPDERRRERSNRKSVSSADSDYRKGRSYRDYHSRQYVDRYQKRDYERRDSTRKKPIEQQRYARDDRRHDPRHSPRVERRLYDDSRKYQQRPRERESDRHIRRQIHEPNQYIIHQKSQHHNPREEDKYKLRKQQDDRRGKYREDLQYRRSKYDRQTSPVPEKYAKLYRQQPRRTNNYEQKPRYYENRQREMFQKSRQKRSRSRQKSFHKQRLHKNNKYENEQQRQRQYRYGRVNYLKDRESPRRDRNDLRNKRIQKSRSKSPYSHNRQSKNYERKTDYEFKVNPEFRKYSSRDQYARNDYRNRPDEMRHTSRGNYGQEVKPYRKVSKRSYGSESSSSNQKNKQRKHQSAPKYKLSDQRRQSPKIKVQKQMQIENQTK